MDVLGLPKVQGLERKVENKTQSPSTSATSSSLKKDTTVSKSSPNGFSSHLEKTLQQKSPVDKKESAKNEKPVARPQEYSRHSKINPPANAESSSVASKKAETSSTEESKNAEKSNKTLKEQELAALMALGSTGNAATSAKAAAAASSVEEKLKLEGLEQKVSPDILPILKFMQTMSQDFKIAPEKIMAALDSLPEKALLQKPQAAITLLLEKLDIQPRQFTKAQILFNQMISDLEGLEKNKASKEIAAGTSADSKNVFSLTKQVQLNPKTDGQIENLKELKDLAHQIQPQAKNPHALSAQKSISNLQTKDIFAQEWKAPLQPSPQSEILNNKNLSPKEMQQLLKQLEAQGGQIQSLDASQTPKSLKAMDFDSFVNKMSMEKNKGSFSASDSQLGDSEADLSSELADKDLLSTLGEKPAERPVSFQKMVDTAVPAQTPQTKAENLQIISKETQMLVQKGGGEMKIQLRPEGMGDVVLKVKVQDGQVGIQITADSVESKKLLEGSLADLKHSLADHKLNLETIKVDVSEKMRDSAQNPNHDFKREEAREFLGQFRQHNDNFRQAAFDSSNVKVYRKNNAVAPDIKPASAKAADAGRLYLVA